MAKKIITHGKKIDKLRGCINAALIRCKRQEALLTRQGVQVGRIHFKTDRPNTMFILEPTVGGKRKYVHVGTDPKIQALKETEVVRWARRHDLRQAIKRLEDEIQELDFHTERLVAIAESVNEHSRIIQDKHVEGERK
ncbi:MAG: hypothetical protein ABW168_05785 [Sedimenticola sp.]